MEMIRTTLIGMFMLAGSAMAAPVSIDQVRSMVMGWRSRNEAPMELPMSKAIASIDVIRDDRAVPLYFAVHLASEGFVLVSPDDEIEPLIAFSARGIYECDERNPLAVLIEADMRERMASLASQACRVDAGRASPWLSMAIPPTSAGV